MASVFLADEAATARFGADLAAALKPGDLVALEGDLGAGKTTLARGAIRSLAGDEALDVPSPTFTLVQFYDARIPLHHFDLYRLGGPDELRELGFDDALAEGVALVEWPDKGGDRIGAGAIRIRLSESGQGRRAEISGPAEAMARIERSLAIRAFLDKAGWGGAGRRFLMGDASARAYETVRVDGESPRILMNAPRRPDGPPIRDGMPYSRIAHLAESVTPFVAVGNALRAAGFAAPEIFAQDLEQGLLLIEHLGGQGFLDSGGRPVAERYLAAARLLADMHRVAWPRRMEAAPGIVHEVPDYDADVVAIETELLIDWYLPSVTGEAVPEHDRAAFRAAWAEVFATLETTEKTLVMRDFHSPNIIWRDGLTGNDRLGLLDFQDALIGPAAYDVASLAQDARVDISPELEAAIAAEYCAARAAAGPFDQKAFEAAYAIMAAQRNSKILGIFVRLDRRDGKPHYLKHLPRIRDYVGRCLAHPALAPLVPIYRRAGLVREQRA